MQDKKTSISLLIAILIIVTLCYLHTIIAPMVGEEMRYASVAWRMFLENNWFIPQIGNAAYLHKPPLLFWFLDAGWWLNKSWPWPTILPIIFAILTVFYTQKLAHALFPERSRIAYLTPFTLIAMPYFINNLGLLRFDMLLTLFNMMACYYLVRSASAKKYYWLFVLVNGLGLLTKGPVIYIFTVSEVILFCLYFSKQPWREAGRLLLGVGLSLCMLAIWWGPIIAQGKSILLHKMFFEQIVARTNGTISVTKPFWDYIPLLPVFFLPWVLFMPFWRAKNSPHENEQHKKFARYLIQVFIICFILFSIIKTKETRYLLPAAPLLAIYIAYRLEKIALTFSRKYYFSTGIIGLLLCLGSASIFVLLHYFPEKIHVFYAHYIPDIVAYILFFTGLISIIGAFFSIKSQIKLLIAISICVSATIDLGTTYAISKTQNLMPTINFISQLMKKNIPVISRSNIVFDMQFSGRWPTWIPVISSQKELTAWKKQHANGWIITSIEKTNITQAYASMNDECFEQSYSHLRAILRVCPVSQDKINIP